MRTRYLVLILAAGAAGFAGCESADSPEMKDDTVTLAVVSYPELDQAVKEKKGSVVVVDFWATWCGPCRERFPHLVKLHSTYAKEGLACISVSLDGLEDKTAALKFLKKQRAQFSNFLWKPSSREEVDEFAERYHYRNAIPHMVVFGRNGTMVWTSADQRLPPDAVEELVDKELDKKP